MCCNAFSYWRRVQAGHSSTAGATRNASLSDWLTSRPGGCSQLKELGFWDILLLYTYLAESSRRMLPAERRQERQGPSCDTDDGPGETEDDGTAHIAYTQCLYDPVV